MMKVYEPPKCGNPYNSIERRVIFRAKDRNGGIFSISEPVRMDPPLRPKTLATSWRACGVPFGRFTWTW